MGFFAEELNFAIGEWIVPPTWKARSLDGGSHMHWYDLSLLGQVGSSKDPGLKEWNSTMGHAYWKYKPLKMKTLTCKGCPQNLL